MNKSESIKELAKALCAVQGEIEGAKKDSTNPHFRSKYADLTSVWDSIRNPLTNHGLAVSQVADTSERDHVCIETILMHTSGEYISGKMTLPVSKPDPQGHGSAITYARRYALAAIVGVCPEDDDAEGATDRTVKPKAHPQPQVEHVGDWRDVAVHFGKNKDKKLGEMTTKSLEWYLDLFDRKVETGEEMSIQDHQLHSALKKGMTK